MHKTEPVLSSIEDVLDALLDVVYACENEENRIGIFASLYRQVTMEIYRAMKNDEFEDGPRMSRFDAAFGTRYFNALVPYLNNDPNVPECWKLAFDACRDGNLSIVQHLLLGINAHINLDLASAAVDVAPGEHIYALKNDYLRVNDILSNTIIKIQSQLDKLSPFMALLDMFGMRTDECIPSFSVKRARGDAFKNAQILAFQDESMRQVTRDLMGAKAKDLAKVVISPPLPWPVMNIVRIGERRDVSQVISHIDDSV